MPATFLFSLILVGVPMSRFSLLVIGAVTWVTVFGSMAQLHAQCQGGGGSRGVSSSTSSTATTTAGSTGGATLLSGYGSWAYDQQMLAQARQQQMAMMARAAAAYQARKAAQEAQQRYVMTQRRQQELDRRYRMREFIALQNGTTLKLPSPSQLYASQLYRSGSSSLAYSSRR